MNHIVPVFCVAVLLLAACGDDPVRRDLTGPAKPAPAAAAAALPEVDTANASSVCRASVRRRQLARLRLSRVPGDPLALSKAKTFNALVTAACK